MPRKSNVEIATLGIDIGKNLFHLIGLDRRGAIVLRQKLTQLAQNRPLDLVKTIG